MQVSPPQSLRKRWATAARWPLGVGLASWRYMWSTTPIHRWEMSGSWPADAPPDLPAGTDPGELQRFEQGVGTLFHRIYRTRIVGSTLTPERLMARISENLDGVAPSEFATFQKIEGEKGTLSSGNRYVVRMPGPWDGPVQVVAADATSFRLATLPGHLEAGQIEFRVSSDYRSLWFEIESWARSGDRLSDALYARLRISKEVQLHMWSSVLRKIVGLTAGQDGGRHRDHDPHGRAERASGRTRGRSVQSANCSPPRRPGCASPQLRRGDDRGSRRRERLAPRRHGRAAAPRGLGAACRGRRLGKSQDRSWTATSSPIRGSSPPPMTKPRRCRVATCCCESGSWDCACGSG